MFGKLNETEIESLLQRQLVGRLGCHTADSIYVVPISYAYDGKYLYGHTFPGKKLEIMRKNPGVCFQVDDTRDHSNWQSVICWGSFEEIQDKESQKQALEILNKRPITQRSSTTMHIGSEWPFSGEDTDKIPGIFFRIAITEKTGKFEKTSASVFFGT